MVLFSSEALEYICDNSLIMLDNGMDAPVYSGMVTVLIKHPLDYEPCTRIVCGEAAALVTRVVLATLDDGMPLKINDTADLIGTGALITSTDRKYPRCRCDSEIVASVIGNLIKLSVERTSDVVHVDTCRKAVAGESFTIIVTQLFDGEHYNPQVTIVDRGEVLYVGDPGNIIILKDEE